MKIMLVLLSAILFAGSAAEAQTCPAASPAARRTIDAFLSSEQYEEARMEAGITPAPTGAARLLVTTTDATVCGRLDMFLNSYMLVPDWRTQSRMAVFAYGGRYYVVITDTDSWRLTETSLIVLDLGYNLLESFTL